MLTKGQAEKTGLRCQPQAAEGKRRDEDADQGPSRAEKTTPNHPRGSPGKLLLNLRFRTLQGKPFQNLGVPPPPGKPPKNIRIPMLLGSKLQISRVRSVELPTEMNVLTKTVRARSLVAGYPSASPDNPPLADEAARGKF